ncbi:Ig-like domain repeat protein [Mumia sp. DW29H23]|uniref:copper amine oxidase n=1 Tax=Mumia sp. DW29H23 TaxID=3421241 RepID=UPI003D6832E4
MTLRSFLAAAALVAGLALVPATAPPAAQAAPPALPCSARGTIAKTLESGSAWRMCWNVHSNKGLVLESVWFKAKTETTYRKVLDSIALGQLNVPYDSGQHQYDDITSYGFGNQYLQKLAKTECPGGTLLDVAQSWQQGTRFVQRTVPAICVQEQDSDLAYRAHEQAWGSVEDKMLFTAQGTELVVSAVAKVDWYEYETQYRFSDNGTITPRLGATGDISPHDFVGEAYGWPVGEGSTDHAASHHHNAIWRVDFGIDQAATQRVEQYDHAPTGAQGTSAPIVAATRTAITTARSVTSAKRRWYRVLAPSSLNADGHPRSYEVAFDKNDPFEANPVTQNEITFTQHDECQQYPSKNPDTTCGASVVDYVKAAYGGDRTITDPVAWVNVGFHHVVRDEDQSPMPVHWQGFQLVPRDFLAQSPLTPLGRECVNGDPAEPRIDSTSLCGNATTTSLRASATRQTYGSATPVRLAVTVAAVKNAARPAGTVSLVDGSRVLRTGIPVSSSGTASYALPATLAAGTHRLVAVYSPKAGTKWVTSRTAPVTVVVARAASRVRVAPATRTVRRGAKVTYRVAVTAPGGRPTGTVTLRAGKTVLATKKLPASAGGRVTVTVRVRKKVGLHRLTATYSGDANVLGSSVRGKVRVRR